MQDLWEEGRLVVEKTSSESNKLDICTKDVNMSTRLRHCTKIQKGELHIIQFLFPKATCHPKSNDTSILHPPHKSLASMKVKEESKECQGTNQTGNNINTINNSD